MKSRSFGDILDANRGAGPGFDLLRLALSVAILFSHSSGISGTGGFLSSTLAHLFHLSPETVNSIGVPADMADPVTRPIRGLGRPYTMSHVPMFFALSGFLVTGSALRTRNVVRFVGLRVLRILPALFVEVTLSAFLLGAVFTTLPISDYFSAHGFWAYFGNIIGDVHMTLPGVFETTSASHVVNSNLWTLPFEFYCYSITVALMLSTLFFNRSILTTLYVIATTGMLIGNVFFDFQVYSGQLRGVVVIYYFFTGVMFFMWRYKVAYNKWLFLASVVLVYPLMLNIRTVFIYPALLTYITLFIGLTAFPRSKLISSGDYSYGIYLYGFPLTQALVAAIPSLRGNLPAVAFGSIVLTSIFSALSWHLVEKHFLKLKKFLSPPSAKITEMLHPAIEGEETVGGTQPSEIRAS